MRTIFLVFGLVFGAGIQAVIAQVIRVTDAESQLPLKGVLIYSKEPQLSVVTESEGEADISLFKDHRSIVIQLLGFESKVLSWKSLSASNFEIQLTPSQITLDVTVIAASRWKQSSQEIPGKVRQLDSQDLTVRAPSTTADWLGSSGEVFVQKSQLGGGSPMIRGFSANRLLYAVDGVRMNTAIFRSGNLQNVISLDPFSLANTEILFGPGSVMYGSDAIGGVMNFETLQPQTQGLSGNIVSRFSSAYSEKTFHADLSYGGKKWKFVTSATHFDYGDLKMGNSGGPDSYLRLKYTDQIDGQDVEITNPDPLMQVGSGYQQLNLMQKVQWKPNDRSTWDYGFHYSEISDIPRYDRLLEERNGQLRFARWDYGPQVWMMNNLKWTYRSNHGWFDQVKVVVAQQYFEESRIDRRFGNVQEFERKEKVYAYSLNADFFKSLKNENYFTYGVEGVTNLVKSEGLEKNIESEAIQAASARYPNSDWTSWAAYGNFHGVLSSRWKIQTALRYNYISLNADFSNNTGFFPLPFERSSQKNHSVTGNIGLIFFPEPSFSISPLVSTGFRAPNVDDLGKIFDSEPGAVIVPNPELKPEYAYNFELNLNKHFQNKFKLDLTGFITYLDNAMVRRPFQLNGESEIIYDGELSEVLAIQNAAFTEIVGFQAGFEWALSKRLVLTSRYNWQKGTEELDDASQSPSRHAAPAFGLTRLAYSHKELRVEISSQYSAARSFEELPEEEKSKTFIYAQDGNGNPFSPAWTIFSLNASYQALSFLQINGGVENIGNLRYRPYSSGIVAPGRNFTLSLKASF
ncbi:TonB-dependent receptor plug domain-containing protein [Algoriphagus confluentis]|uniref:TonB-dependent receptor n=1 Tax=Algoriphagus confluentis TaxID=1697556 RepID=A0ABQ6PIH4_9BACT|nr:TonB-dependent receptor [Algoriphagus confluentis]